MSLNCESIRSSFTNRQYELPLSAAIFLPLVGNMFIECIMDSKSSLHSLPNLSISTLPSVPAVHAKHEHGHRLVGAPRLFLRTGCFDAFAPSACKQRCLQQIPLDPAHVINLLFIRPLPIQSDRSRIREGGSFGLSFSSTLNNTHYNNPEKLTSANLVTS